MLSKEHTKKLKEEFILISANRLLSEIRILREYAKKNELLSSQEWIDFEDKLNLISVEDPNK